MFKTKAGNSIRLRVTIIVEARSQKDLEGALHQAVGLGKARVLGMSFGSRKKDGPTVSVRTTRARGKREQSK